MASLLEFRAAALIVVALFRWRGHIGNVATAGAVVAMIFPPWIIPGAGVVVLTIIRCVARGKDSAATETLTARIDPASVDERPKPVSDDRIARSTVRIDP